MNQTEQKAQAFATRAHGMVVNPNGTLGQLRKYNNAPYTDHLQEVAATVAQYGGTEEMICAAWLHDVVEDTPVQLHEIEEAFGTAVATLVADLTDLYTKDRYPALNRGIRKNLEAERLGLVSADAQTIKYADIISNATSIFDRDPKFAIVYKAEMQAIIQRMTDGNAELRARALKILDRS